MRHLVQNAFKNPFLLESSRMQFIFVSQMKLIWKDIAFFVLLYRTIFYISRYLLIRGMLFIFFALPTPTREGETTHRTEK